MLNQSLQNDVVFQVHPTQYPPVLPSLEVTNATIYICVCFLAANNKMDLVTKAVFYVSYSFSMSKIKQQQSYFVLRWQNQQE